MFNRMIAMGSGGSEEPKDYFIKGSDSSSLSTPAFGEYTIGNTITANGSSYSAIGIILGKPKTVYVQGNSATTKVMFEDGTFQSIGNTKTLVTNAIGASVTTSSGASLTVTNP